MTYREPLSDQVLMFIGSIGPGVLIGFLYDVIFSFFRAFGNKKALIVTADLCFSVLATLLSFFYMVVFNSGIVRLNIIVAQLIGAVAFHYTLGKYISKPVTMIANFSGKVIGFIFYPAVLIGRKAGEYPDRIREKIRRKGKEKEKSDNANKKIMNILKIHLKK